MNVSNRQMSRMCLLYSIIHRYLDPYTMIGIIIRVNNNTNTAFVVSHHLYRMAHMVHTVHPVHTLLRPSGCGLILIGSLGLWIFGSLGLWVFGSLGLWIIWVTGVTWVTWATGVTWADVCRMRGAWVGPRKGLRALHAE